MACTARSDRPLDWGSPGWANPGTATKVVGCDEEAGVLMLDEGLAEGVLGGGRVQDRRGAVRRRHDLLVSETRKKRSIIGVVSCH